MAAEKLYSQEHHSNTTAYLERLHDSVVEAATEHQSKFFHVEAFQELREVPAFAATALQIFCDISPPCPPGAVPRISVWSLPFVGPKFHLSIKNFQAVIMQDLVEHPSTSVHCVILPNCPKYGAPAAVGHAHHAAIQDFKDLVVSAVREIGGVLMAQCFALYEEETMYSTLRELKVEFMLVVSDCTHLVGKENVLRCVWSKSQLFKRRCIVKPVEVMQRHMFKDWNNKNMCYDRGHFSEVQELRQHHSGTSLLGALLRGLCKGLNFSKDARVMVKDMTLYDDQLAAAVLALNCKGDNGLPLFGYTGLAWGGKVDKNRMRVDNIVESINEMLVAHAKVNTSSLPHFKQSSSRVPAPISDATQKPQYSEAHFQVTCPRANAELPIRQSVYDKFSNKPFLATNPLPGGAPLSWSDIVAQHNLEFNPTGVPYKAKRTAEESLEAVVVANPDPVTLPALAADDPQDEAGLLAAKGVAVGSGNALFKYVIMPGGKVYISGLEDGVVQHTQSLFVIRGEAKQGPAAIKAMKDSEHWVPYKLEPDSLVSVTFTAPVKGQFSEEPIRLAELLSKLEDAGHVRVHVHLHTVARDPTLPGTYTISQAEADTAIILVKIEENLTEDDRLTTVKLGNYVDLTAMKQCPRLTVVHRFQFNPGVNKLMGGFPAIYPAKPWQIQKGQVYKLF